MAIFGTDDRILVVDEDVTIPPYNSVVAVDSRRTNLPRRPALGSGIIVGLNHILTAAHVVAQGKTIDDIDVQLGGRILLPEQLQPADGSSFLPRSITTISFDDDNVKFAEKEDLLPSPENSLRNDSSDDILREDNDIALLNLTDNNETPDLSNRAMGIITFSNEFDLRGVDKAASERIQVATAGYPGIVERGEISESKNEPFITIEWNGRR